MVRGAWRARGVVFVLALGWGQAFPAALMGGDSSGVAWGQTDSKAIERVGIRLQEAGLLEAIQLAEDGKGEDALAKLKELQADKSKKIDSKEVDLARLIVHMKSGTASGKLSTVQRGIPRDNTGHTNTGSRARLLIEAFKVSEKKDPAELRSRADWLTNLRKARASLLEQEQKEMDLVAEFLKDNSKNAVTIDGKLLDALQLAQAADEARGPAGDGPDAIAQHSRGLQAAFNQLRSRWDERMNRFRDLAEERRSPKRGKSDKTLRDQMIDVRGNLENIRDCHQKLYDRVEWLRAKYPGRASVSIPRPFDLPAKPR